MAWGSTARLRSASPPPWAPLVLRWSSPVLAHRRRRVGLLVALVASGLLSAALPVVATGLALLACGAACLAVVGAAPLATGLVALLPWLIIFLEPVPDELRTMVAALGAGFAFLAVLSRRRPSGWLFGASLLLVPAFLSLPTASGAGAFQFLRYLAFVALVGLLVSERGSDLAGRMTRVALPSACAALLVHAAVVTLGLGSTGTYYGFGERLGYASSPHDLAFFAAGAGIAAFLRFDRATLRYGFFALAATITLLTGVRSAMAGLILFAALLAFRRGARMQQLAVVLAATAAVWATGTNQVVTERLLKSEQSGEFSQISSAGSGRGEIWSNAIVSWQDAGPVAWLFGTGLRSLPGLSQKAFGTPFTGHSDLIEIGVQLGLVGLAGYLVLVVLVIRAASTKLVLTVLGAAAVLNGALEYIAPLTLILVFAGAKAAPLASRATGPARGRSPARTRSTTGSSVLAIARAPEG
jgi:O-antigen ligase